MTPPVVLLVDDDAEILSSMEDLFSLELPGVRVLTATNPIKALEICKREKPAVIVSDYRMPEMDGIQFLKRSLALAPNAKRLIMSAYADPEVAKTAVSQVDVAFVITKPFQLEYFVQLVESLLKPSGAKAAR